MGRVPASMPPIITKSAPKASAFTMSPGVRMPPSATMERSARAHSLMAVSWGTPKPVLRRVVQTLPGPMPTFTMSAFTLAR